MSIYRVHAVRIVCDECSTDFGWSEFASVAEAEREARDAGWLVISRRNVRCPDCTEDECK